MAATGRGLCTHTPHPVRSCPGTRKQHPHGAGSARKGLWGARPAGGLEEGHGTAWAGGPGPPLRALRPGAASSALHGSMVPSVGWGRRLRHSPRGLGPGGMWSLARAHLEQLLLTPGGVLGKLGSRFWKWWLGEGHGKGPCEARPCCSFSGLWPQAQGLSAASPLHFLTRALVLGLRSSKTRPGAWYSEQRGHNSPLFPFGNLSQKGPLSPEQCPLPTRTWDLGSFEGE